MEQAKFLKKTNQVVALVVLLFLIIVPLFLILIEGFISAGEGTVLDSLGE